MYVDSRTIEDGTDIDVDICIVGAGAAGITMATELSGGSLPYYPDAGPYTGNEATPDS